MNDNFAINNKTSNLIPIVNKELDIKLDGLLKSKNGIQRALLHRIFPSIEIDSSEIVTEAYREYYGNDIAKSADTIINAFIPFRSFCISRLKNFLNHQLVVSIILLMVN